MTDAGDSRAAILERDRLLLEKAKERPEAVADVYDAYADKVYGFLLKRCGQKETAEDFTSRVFLKFLEQVPKLEWKGVSLGAWLFQVATNLLTDHWRSAAVQKNEPMDEDWDAPSLSQDPSWFAELSLESEKLLVCLKQLSVKDQEMLDLRFFAQQEIPDIALALGVSENLVSVRIYRALGRLRGLYLKMYASIAAK